MVAIIMVAIVGRFDHAIGLESVVDRSAAAAAPARQGVIAYSTITLRRMMVVYGDGWCRSNGDGRNARAARPTPVYDSYRSSIGANSCSSCMHAIECVHNDYPLSRRCYTEYGRFADTYNCIKTAFHDTDILADILARSQDVGEDVGVVECSLYAIVCVGETFAPLLYYTSTSASLLCPARAAHNISSFPYRRQHHATWFNNILQPLLHGNWSMKALCNLLQ